MEQLVDLRDAPIRVAIAGLGVIGRQHARLLSELDCYEFVGACDADPAVSSDISERYAVPVTDTWAGLVELRPDCIVNALPTHLHYESTRLFLEAGLHVLVEKPITSDSAEATELAKLANEAERVLLVGHVERFNAGVLSLRQEIQNGRFGDIVNVSTRRVGVARPAIPHANVALDLAIHDVDVIRFLLGRSGRLINAFGSAMRGNLMEDHVDMLLLYGDTVCTVQANWITPVKIRRLTVTGTKATAELDYMSQALQIFESSPQIIKGDSWDFFAVSNVSPPVDIGVKKSEPLRAELLHFAACVRGEGEPVVTPEEAREALELVIAATDQSIAGVSK